MDLKIAIQDLREQIILWERKEFRSINAGTLYYIECRERIEALKTVMKYANAYPDMS